MRCDNSNNIFHQDVAVFLHQQKAVDLLLGVALRSSSLRLTVSNQCIVSYNNAVMFKGLPSSNRRYVLGYLETWLVQSKFVEKDFPALRPCECIMMVLALSNGLVRLASSKVPAPDSVYYKSAFMQPLLLVANEDSCGQPDLALCPLPPSWGRSRPSEATFFSLFISTLFIFLGSFLPFIFVLWIFSPFY